jgi:hypothetical protein
VDIVVLEDFGKCCLVFVICSDDASTSFFLFSSTRLSTSQLSNGLLDQKWHAVRLRIITSCSPREMSASTILRPTAPVPPATATTIILANGRDLDQNFEDSVNMR